MSERSSHHGSGRDAAVAIVRTLRDAGHVAYLAGGCVRDDVMGVPPKDYDVATDAKPERVKSLFPKARYVGEAFGVVLVRVKGHSVEVATFRREWGYTDGRRPDKVEFTDAEEDARRRDFTINGLFEDPLRDGGEADAREAAIIDYVGGREDIRNRVVRAIGDPEARFSEDYLRLLRAVRFAARLGFTIEERTAKAIRARADKLAAISRERIGVEIGSMLSPPRKASQRAESARLMQELRLDAPALTEEHRAAPLPTLASLRDEATYPAALTAWMIDRFVTLPTEPDGTRRAIGEFTEHESETVIARWREAICLSNDVRDAVQHAFDSLAMMMDWPTLDTARRKRLMATRGWNDAVDLLNALARHDRLVALAHDINHDAAGLGAHTVRPDPFVTGDDLIALGQRPGPAFKHVLDEAYDRQLDGTLATREAALAWLRDRARRSG